jgi:uncharacterized membrane protein YphA (DoxX/SURF4 family)
VTSTVWHRENWGKNDGMTLSRLIARPLMSSMFIVGGINALKNSESLAQRAKPVLDRLVPKIEQVSGGLPVPTDGKLLVQVNGAVNIVAGAMLATGKAPRLSAVALAVSLVPTTLGGHRYWEESDPRVRANQRIHFFKNVSMLGGLVIAALDTEGRPSLAWRAKHQVAKAKGSVAELASR